MVSVKNNVIDSNNMYLAANLLIKTSNITVSNDDTYRKLNMNPYGFNEMYMDKDLIEDKVYEMKDKFSERKIMLEVYSLLLNRPHPFYDGNGRTCKILFANDDKINKLTDGTKNLKSIIHKERSMFSKISNSTIKGQINFYSRCID